MSSYRSWAKHCNSQNLLNKIYNPKHLIRQDYERIL